MPTPVTSQPAPIGSNTSSTGVIVTLRDANKTYVRDQAEKWRMSETNSLGQLVKVTEDPTSAISEFTHTGTNLLTEYSYDTLSNLTGVSQAYSGGTQTRTFTYSSAARLLTAANPESGTIAYQYDGNGNLAHKQDARGVDTSYVYDALNRPTTRTYDDGTPTVTYTYDGSGVPFGKGRLASVSSSVSTTSYTKYDATGKLLENSQTTDGLAVCSGSSAACLMTYKYNLAGALTEETYPSGRVVHHNYAADGKLTATSSRVTAKRPFRAYAQNFTYNAAGAVTDMQLGNMRWEHTEFNARLQPVKIALGTTAGADNMLDLTYGYGTSQNNGNVMSQTISVDDVGAVHGFLAEQTYTYDELNRLKSATEMNTPNMGSQSQSWKQTYSFDRFGNRRFDTTSGATTTIPGGCSTAVCNPTFDLSNNRFASGQGYDYDDAGNVTQDAEGKKFVYDAENKQKSFGTGGDDDDNGGTYVYDGDGRRVKKIVGTEVTIFVYDASGQLVAEYATTTPTSPQVSYLTADSLASPRINTDASGAIIARHDYMPYGEEIFTVGSRISGISYGDDDIRLKFTAYERDEESNLDFAQARMFSSKLGRFTSPDPLYIEAERLGDPQQWNLYLYGRNSPLVFVDPDGLDITVTGDYSAEYLAYLQRNLPGLELSINAETNLIEIATPEGGDETCLNPEQQRLSAIYANTTDDQRALVDAILDPNNHATIDTVSGDPNVDFGRFEGDGKNTVDVADLAKLDAPGNSGGFSASQAAAHETLEAYAGSKLKGMSKESAYSLAHDSANRNYPGLIGPLDGTAKIYRYEGGTDIVMASSDFEVAGTPGKRIRVTRQLVTPIPENAAGFGTALKPAHIVDVRRLP